MGFTGLGFRVCYDWSSTIATCSDDRMVIANEDSNTLRISAALQC